MSKNKKYTLDVKRFLSFIAVIVFIVAVIIVLIASNRKVEINDATDISKLNVSKSSKEILKEYNKDGMEEKFISDFDNLQNGISIYLISNSSTDSSTFENLVVEVNGILKTGNFEKLELTNPKTWNGTWSLDDSGKLKFKFENSSIEPSWVNDSKVQGKIIKN